jgi:hypothetical protein
VNVSLRTFAVPTILVSILITAAAPHASAATLRTAAPSNDAPHTAVLGSVAGHGRAAAASSRLHVKSYNARTGSVVLNTAHTAVPKTGQLIASPPTAGAPHGFLASVTAVHPAANGTVAVDTKPADVSQLLGASDVQASAAVDGTSITVTPLIGTLQTTYTDWTGGAAGSATDSLGLSVDASVPIPGTSAAASLSGSLVVAPTVDFSYDGAGIFTPPQQAHIGLDLGAQAHWKVGAALAAGTSMRVPLATLSANPVVTVAGFPVVINLSLELDLVVDASGQISISSEQTFDGDWSVGADYTASGGWTSDAPPATITVTPVSVTASGDATLTTGLAADARVGLYDTVGIEGTIEPYLRNVIDGSVTLDSAGDPPSGRGSWQLYGGIVLGGDLYAQLSILGTPILSGTLPFPGYSQEWLLYQYGAAL